MRVLMLIPAMILAGCPEGPRGRRGAARVCGGKECPTGDGGARWRWQEWVFGGATQYVLRHMTMPALMTH